MPLLEINQTRRISATIRLDQATAAQIDQYAAFLNASADEVVDKALAYVFTKDRDFQDFLRSEGAAQVPQRLRIRHSPHPSANLWCCRPNWLPGTVAVWNSGVVLGRQSMAVTPSSTPAAARGSTASMVSPWS